MFAFLDGPKIPMIERCVGFLDTFFFFFGFFVTAMLYAKQAAFVYRMTQHVVGPRDCNPIVSRVVYVHEGPGAITIGARLE